MRFYFLALLSAFLFINLAVAEPKPVSLADELKKLSQTLSTTKQTPESEYIPGYILSRFSSPLIVSNSHRPQIDIPLFHLLRRIFVTSHGQKLCKSLQQTSNRLKGNDQQNCLDEVRSSIFEKPPKTDFSAKVSILPEIYFNISNDPQFKDSAWSGRGITIIQFDPQRTTDLDLLAALTHELYQTVDKKNRMMGIASSQESIRNMLGLSEKQSNSCDILSALANHEVLLAASTARAYRFEYLILSEIFGPIERFETFGSNIKSSVETLSDYVRLVPNYAGFLAPYPFSSKVFFLCESETHRKLQSDALFAIEYLSKQLIQENRSILDALLEIEFMSSFDTFRDIENGGPRTHPGEPGRKSDVEDSQNSPEKKKVFDGNK